MELKTLTIVKAINHIIITLVFFGLRFTGCEVHSVNRAYEASITSG